MKNQIFKFPSLYTLQNYKIPLKIKNLGLDELSEVFVNPLFEWDFINVLVREPENLSSTSLFLKFSKNKYIFNTKIYNKPYLGLENGKLYFGLDYRFLKNKFLNVNNLIFIKARFLSYNVSLKKILKFNKKKKTKKRNLYIKQKFLLFYIFNFNRYFAAFLPKNLIVNKFIIKNKNYKKIISFVLRRFRNIQYFLNIFKNENSVFLVVKRQNSNFLSTKFIIFLFKSAYASKLKKTFDSKNSNFLIKKINMKNFFKEIKKINPLNKFQLHFDKKSTQNLATFLKFKILF